MQCVPAIVCLSVSMVTPVYAGHLNDDSWLYKRYNLSLCCVIFSKMCFCNVYEDVSHLFLISTQVQRGPG